MSRKVFVSGGAGVIGRPLVAKLLQEGAEVFVVDLKPEPKEWPKRVLYLQGDINQMDGEKLISFDPDVCFHLAATFERSEESPSFIEENFYNNVLLSHALLHALQKCSRLRKVIFASSYLIYDPSLYFFDKIFLEKETKAASLDEDSRINPRNLCGTAKLLHEKELEFIEKTKNAFSTISARIFRVYGKGSRDVISRWVRQALEKKEIIVYGKEAMFDYIFAEDVAEGILRLANTKASGIVNLGTGKARKVEEIVEILKEHFPKIVVKDEKTKDETVLEASQANMEKFELLTGWMPKTSLEKGIAKIIGYEKD